MLYMLLMETPCGFPLIKDHAVFEDGFDVHPMFP